MAAVLPSLLPAVVGAGVSYFANKEMAKGLTGAISSVRTPAPPPIPTVQIPQQNINVPQQNVTVATPEPVAPPNAPLSPNMTAAVQRARRQDRGGAGSSTKLTLTTPSSRQEYNPGTIARATLLGR